MKKIIVISLLLLSVLAWTLSSAADLKNIGGVLYTSPAYTLLSGVSTTGTVGTAQEFTSAAHSARAVPVWSHLFTLTWTGVTPSNVVVNIDLSQDGTNYYTAAAWTVTSSPSYTWFNGYPAAYTRSTYVSRSNGSTNTTVTLTGTSGGVR